MGWDKQGNFVPKVLVDKTFQDYTESVVDYGVVTDSCILDLTNGTVQKTMLTSSVTCVFTMPNPVAGKSFVLFIHQPVSTGGQGSVVFADVHWPNNVAPTVTATPGKIDIYTFFSDGINWYGSYTQSYSGVQQDVSLVSKFKLPNPGNTVYPSLMPIRRAIKAKPRR